MANTVDSLKTVAICMDELRETTKINENPNNNPLIDAYNKGVEAFYASAMAYITPMIGGARESEMNKGGEK